MRHKRGVRVKHITHNLMARGIWPILIGLSIFFLILGINKPGVQFNNITSVLYIGFVLTIITTIYFVYKD